MIAPPLRKPKFPKVALNSNLFRDYVKQNYGCNSRSKKIDVEKCNLSPLKAALFLSRSQEIS
jgi:hypothetical protein